MSTETDPVLAGHRRPAGRRLLRAVLWLTLLLVIAAVAGGLWLRHELRSSLARLDGELALAGLEGPVTIERDAAGVPTIRGQDRRDVARALGFLHGQDRFFQLDLIRRSAAGELAEVFGDAALPADRQIRIHRFRSRAERDVAALSGGHRGLLEAYAEGVNAGLDALDAPPFEYLVLRADPAPWQPADSLLAVYAMYLDLQGRAGRRESIYGVLHDVLPAELAEFLAPRGTEWDAPIVGQPFATPPVPSPAVFDLRSQPPPAEQLDEVAAATFEERDLLHGLVPGSNNWAVAGSHTADGRALVANDMHLGLQVPNIWYRVSLVFPDPSAPGGERRVTGVSLPGAMLVVVGSNGQVAWGFTNTQGDWADVVLLEDVPGDDDAYSTPDGPRAFERHSEVLRSADGGEETLEVLSTLWGPVIEPDHRGRRRALRWVAHDPPAVNFGLQELERAADLEQAVEIANRSGTPAQNFMVADSSGRIGWTVAGPIPRRFGHDGRLPSSWADGSRGWQGWLWPEQYPRVLDPESGKLWTANARVVSGELLDVMGDGGYALGARAGQIRDALMALERATVEDLLAIQLDDRALFLERWRRLLLDLLDAEAAAGGRRAELERLVDDWGGRAAVGSAGYRLVRGFRLTVEEEVYESLTAACREADESFRYGFLSHREGPLWRLVTERPAHLLDPRYDSWSELLLAAVDELLDDLLGDGGQLADQTWGARNRVRVQHPMSRALPLLGRWLDMPPAPLPGDTFMPRVQSVGFGASERLVVSPGDEQNGVFHMPTGQSGHPMSPHYGDGHRAWMEGHPTAFLPGPTVHTLRLVPSSSATQ